MHLTPHEEHKFQIEGWSYVAALISLTLAIAAASTYFLSDYTSTTKKLLSTTEETQTDLKRKNKDIVFLKGNKESIESMWNTLRVWGQGISSTSLNPLIQAGLDSMPAAAPAPAIGTNISFAVVDLRGERTEFQRLTSALSTLETEQGLLQVKSAKLFLPANIPPYYNKPTYLAIEMQVAAPMITNGQLQMTSGGQPTHQMPTFLQRPPGVPPVFPGQIKH
jgi:hypothetical protein